MAHRIKQVCLSVNGCSIITKTSELEVFKTEKKFTFCTLKSKYSQDFIKIKLAIKIIKSTISKFKKFNM